MIEDVGNVGFGILVARDSVLDGVDSVGFVYGAWSWETQPVQPCHSLLPTSIPVELARVGYDDTGSTVVGSCSRSVEHTLNEVEHRTLVDALIAGDSVRQDQRIGLSFWEEDDNSLLRSNAWGEVNGDVFVGWAGS